MYPQNMPTGLTGNVAQSDYIAACVACAGLKVSTSKPVPLGQLISNRTVTFIGRSVGCVQHIAVAAACFYWSLRTTNARLPCHVPLSQGDNSTKCKTCVMVRTRLDRTTQIEHQPMRSYL